MPAKKQMTEEQRAKKREKELRKQANKLNRQLKSSQKKPKGARQAQADFLDFVVEKYGVLFISTSLSRKLLSINDGTYTGLTQPIPFEDLLDMFGFCKKKINEARLRKKKNGEELSGVNQFNYDLAIVLSEADNYYKHKEESREKLEASIESVNYQIEKAIAQQDIARKKKRLRELEEEKRERQRADLSELFSEF